VWKVPEVLQRCGAAVAAHGLSGSCPSNADDCSSGQAQCLDVEEGKIADERKRTDCLYFTN